MSNLPEDDSAEAQAWRSKVRSVDDTLKSLRSASAKAKPRKAKDEPPPRPAGRGLFSFLSAKPAPPIPLEKDLAGE